MSRRGPGLLAAALITGCLAHSEVLAAEPYEQRSAGARALYTSVAVAANILPVLSAVYAPQCLPGYIACKLGFAGMSLLAAGDQLLLSGGSDPEQARAIVNRGFSGDWVLTGKHIAGDATPQPLPEAPPPKQTDGGGAWEPPPR
jgi:hypothetical protein